MDFQHREGGKTGTGGLLSASESNADRRERLKKLALETIDLSRDPYFLKNHLGSYECRLCLTLHVNEGSYLVHTQGKKHQANLGRRRARESAISNANANASNVGMTSSLTVPVTLTNTVYFSGVKLGRPGYKIVKIRDPVTKYFGLRIQVHYPQPFSPELPRPQTRLMSAFEQRIEPPNKLFQYLVIAAPTYESVALKVPAKEIYENWSWWDEDTKLFTNEIIFKQ